MKLRAQLPDIPEEPTEEQFWEEFANAFDPEKQMQRKKERLKNYWIPFQDKTMMTKNFIKKVQKRSPIPIKEAQKFEDKVETPALNHDERLVFKFEDWFDNKFKKEKPLPKNLEEVAQAFQNLLQEEIDKIEILNFRPVLCRRGNYLGITTHEYEYFWQTIHFEKSDNPGFMRFRAFDSEDLRQVFNGNRDTNCTFWADVKIGKPYSSEDSAYKAYVQLLNYRVIGTFRANTFLYKQLRLDEQ